MSIFSVREFFGSTFSGARAPRMTKKTRMRFMRLSKTALAPRDEFPADLHLMSKIIEKNSSFYLLSRVHECILREAAETNGFEKDFGRNVPV